MARKHERGSRDGVETGAPAPKPHHSLRSNMGEHRGKVIGDRTHITGQKKTMGHSEPGRKRGAKGGGQTGRNTPATPEFQAPRYAGIGTRKGAPRGYRGSF